MQLPMIMHFICVTVSNNQSAFSPLSILECFIGQRTIFFEIEQQQIEEGRGEAWRHNQFGIPVDLDCGRRVKGGQANPKTIELKNHHTDIKNTLFNTLRSLSSEMNNCFTTGRKLTLLCASPYVYHIY